MIYRIRKYGQVVGYMKCVGNYELFSRDLYGWSGTPIDYDCLDMDSGIRDVNNQRLFLLDTVNVRFSRFSSAYSFRKCQDGMLTKNDEGEIVFRELPSNRDYSLECIRGATIRKTGTIIIPLSVN